MTRHDSSVLAAVAAMLLLGGSAAAIEQDAGTGGGLTCRSLRRPRLPQVTEPLTFLGLPFDVAFGAAVTSDYVSRGITNSAGHPAIQGYIEPSVGPFYFNVWASNVDFGADEFEGAEIDTAVGLRHDIGPASLDVGYVHYFYAPEEVSPDYGEIYGKGDFKVKDFLTLGGARILRSRLQSERKDCDVGGRRRQDQLCRTTSRSTAASDISSSRIRTHSSSWPGWPAHPTTGSPSPLMSATGRRTFRKTNANSAAEFSMAATHGSSPRFPSIRPGRPSAMYLLRHRPH